MQNLDKWIEIDVDAVSNNLLQVRSRLEEHVRLIAVLKADAYGHGAVETARLLARQGVDFFAVTFLEEALQIRKGGIQSSILLFAPLVGEEQVNDALENFLTLSIASLRDIDLLLKACRDERKTVTVHLKVDTGLGRFGLTADEVREACRALKQHPNIYIEGIYTHMADAARAQGYTEIQFRRFRQVLEMLEKEGYYIPIKHCANSAVFLKYPHMHLDAVRIGTLLSGQHPVGRFARPLSLRDPYCFKSRIISLRTLEKGSYLGYYRTYRLRKKAQIAVIPVGFKDGLALEIANPPAGFIDFLKGIARHILVYLKHPRFSLRVNIKGRSYPVRGKVFMQMALVEIPLEVEVQVGDQVELPVRKTLAAANIVRVYVKEGEAGKINRGDATTFILEED